MNWLAANGESGIAASPSAASVMTPNKQRVMNGVCLGGVCLLENPANQDQDSETPDISRTYSSPSAGAAPPAYSDDSPSKAESPSGDQSATSRAAAAVSSTAEMTYDEVKNKLAQAQAEIAKLKDGGLRQRNVKSGEGSEKQPVQQAAQAVKQQSAEGVSVQVVALLCLLSFLLAYFFF